MIRHLPTLALILFFAAALSPLAWNAPWLLMQWGMR